MRCCRRRATTPTASRRRSEVLPESTREARSPIFPTLPVKLTRSRSGCSPEELAEALEHANIRTLQYLSLVNLATTPTAIDEKQLAILLEAAEVAGVSPREV